MFFFKKNLQGVKAAFLLSWRYIFRILKLNETQKPLDGEPGTTVMVILIKELKGEVSMLNNNNKDYFIA